MMSSNGPRHRVDVRVDVRVEDAIWDRETSLFQYGPLLLEGLSMKKTLPRSKNLILFNYFREILVATLSNHR